MFEKKLNILIVAATEYEINKCMTYVSDKHKIDFLITGIGLTLTAYRLTKTLITKKYDLVINAGICGSFSKDISIGEVINIESEIFGDFGIDDNGIYKTFFEEHLMNPNEYPFNNGIMYNKNKLNDYLISNISLNNKTGLTVNKVHGNQIAINQIIKKFNTQTESMEGAAVFYICLLENIPFFEIRAVSNYVEPRNKANWNIPLAIHNLNNELINLLNNLK